ncbi:MAG: hypothetical protein ACRC1H_03975, partial [Caldilineaceae bacterium]
LRRGVARIGRTGVKLHPIVERVTVRSDGSPLKYFDFACSCTGTNNGHAHSRATLYWGNARANCGNQPQEGLQ